MEQQIQEIQKEEMTYNTILRQLPIKSLKWIEAVKGFSYIKSVANWNDLVVQLKNDHIFKQRDFSLDANDMVIIGLSKTSSYLFNSLMEKLKIPIKKYGENQFKETEFKRALKDIRNFLSLCSAEDTE